MRFLDHKISRSETAVIRAQRTNPELGNCAPSKRTIKTSGSKGNFNVLVAANSGSGEIRT